MFIKSIKISNFKSFYKGKVITFALPTGKIGSGLTIITGANNSGKSTIFDAVKKLSPNEKITVNERNTQQTTIKITDSVGKKKNIRNINTGSQIEIQGDSTLNIDSFEFIGSRRSWNHRFNGESDYDGYRSGRNNQKDKLAVDNNLGTLLSRINKDSAKKLEFNTYINQIFYDFNDWTIDTDEQGDYIRYIAKNGTTHLISLVGDGVISIFRIISHLIYTTNEKILLIDEPELSLQPQAIISLSRIIADLSKNKQIIIATHSPYFINWNNIINGAEVFKLSKEEDKETKVYKINKKKEYYKKNIANSNFQTPHLMDLASKEIFFTHNILFLEGQEDVSLLNKFITENDISINFTIFGYGSGGADNIPVLLDLANDLGIRKVGAIFDNDKPLLITECKRIYPNNYIVGISKDDIRDKYKDKIKKDNTTVDGNYYILDKKAKSSNILFKSGLFTSKGEIKSSSKNELLTIINNFIVYCK